MLINFEKQFGLNMNNFYKPLFLLFVIQLSFSQNKSLWKSYYSYNDIVDITQSNDRIFAASENAVFTKSKTNNELKTINTIDGLSSEQISSIYHSKTLNKTIVGYENGLLTVINQADGSIKKIVDIINKQLPSNIKRVNSFDEFDGIVYVSCDFGIVQFNLKTLLFGDTYFIGSLTPEIKVLKTTVFNNTIYAATRTEGIKSAPVNGTNLIDATQWTQVVTGDFLNVTTFGNSLFALSSSGQVSKSENGVTYTNFGAAFAPLPNDIRATDKNLIITTPNSVSIYDTGLTRINQINISETPKAQGVFTKSTIIDNDLYIGTSQSGVINCRLDNTSFQEIILPNGPTMNDIFSVNTSTSNLWAVYGKYDEEFYGLTYSLFGFSKYNRENGWVNIGADKVNDARDLVRVTVNPNNESELFISSYSSGLLKYENEKLVFKYEKTNSGLESAYGNPKNEGIFIEQSAFDKNGNLWLTNITFKNAIKVLNKDGKWKSYSIENSIPKFDQERFGRMVIDKNGTKWIASKFSGVVGFNEEYNNKFVKITRGEAVGNLPSERVDAIAIDNKNQLWIGTGEGLRVVSNVDRFINERNINSEAIIFLEEDLPQELLYQQWITDIVVDGANNKWIATKNGGVYKVSSNGKETIYHFTTLNSPLPSNFVRDIDINPKTGEVFFVTLKGMVSYMGLATSGQENLENVIVFPNPVRPEYSGTVKISGLIDKANVKVTDIEGNLVFEGIAEGGTIEWDTTAFGKYKVASGVYMILIAASESDETKIKKVMIIR
jgi:ligand-binding sensor domain-containing protein